MVASTRRRWTTRSAESSPSETKQRSIAVKHRYDIFATVDGCSQRAPRTSYWKTISMHWTCSGNHHCRSLFPPSSDPATAMEQARRPTASPHRLGDRPPTASPRADGPVVPSRMRQASTACTSRTTRLVQKASQVWSDRDLHSVAGCCFTTCRCYPVALGGIPIYVPSSVTMAKRLFERADSDSDRVFLPMHIYGGGVFTSGVRTQSIDIGGRNIDNLFSDRRLSRMVENEVVDAFLNLPSAQVILATQFDMPREKIWCLVRAERRTMLPLSPVGEIGEFDIIVGRIIDDYVDLSTLGLVECKLAKTQASATEHSTKMPKYSSGWGTTQLSAARGLGFDFLLAAHFLVRPPSEVPDQSWSSAADAANFRREAERLHGMMEARETNRSTGSWRSVGGTLWAPIHVSLGH